MFTSLNFSEILVNKYCLLVFFSISRPTWVWKLMDVPLDFWESIHIFLLCIVKV